MGCIDSKAKVYEASVAAALVKENYADVKVQSVGVCVRCLPPPPKHTRHTPS